jgi:hypothetical protein
MYFAGDGFSEIRGGFDSLAPAATKALPKGGFDVIETNPPYGKSAYGRTEEAFLHRVVEALKPGTGWGCIVLPTGVLENPRSKAARFKLLNQSQVTDVIALPKHAFAPYTQQRTAIAIFQRRKKPLVSETADWKALVDACGHERISMFIVDNDGYANSDKRYRTDRKAVSGEWLHNDLAPWTDASGILRPSKLYAAAVNNQKPASPINERGEPLGEKWGVLAISALVDDQRGVGLLPDIPLRGDIRELPLHDWKMRVDNLVAFSRGEDIILPTSFADEVKFLLEHAISFQKGRLQKPKSIDQLFTVSKGDTGLTEAMIYREMDIGNGIPVYGGGAGAPKFKASTKLTTQSGEPAHTFSGPAVVVSMDGSAGSIQVIDKGSFFCNHHGAVLKPNNTSVNLWCFAQCAEPALRRLASNKGSSATLTKPALETLVVSLPKAASDIATVERGRRALTLLSRMVQ